MAGAALNDARDATSDAMKTLMGQLRRSFETVVERPLSRQAYRASMQYLH